MPRQLDLDWVKIQLKTTLEARLNEVIIASKTGIGIPTDSVKSKHSFTLFGGQVTHTY